MLLLTWRVCGRVALFRCPFYARYDKGFLCATKEGREPLEQAGNGVKVLSIEFHAI